MRTLRHWAAEGRRRGERRSDRQAGRWWSRAGNNSSRDSRDRQTDSQQTKQGAGTTDSVRGGSAAQRGRGDVRARAEGPLGAVPTTRRRVGRCTHPIRTQIEPPALRRS
jgi:hypothetical protein